MTTTRDIPGLIGSGDLLQTFADLKAIPLDTVLHNAAKDCIQGMWLTTPEAAAEPLNHWAYLPGRGKAKGKTVTVNLLNLPPMERVRLSPYRLARRRHGYALAAYIPVMRELEFKTKKPPKSAPGSVLERIWSAFQTRGGGDGFKGALEAFRQGASHHATPSDYSSTASGGAETSPYVEVTVAEYDLKHYPQWSDAALEAGMKRAANFILRELDRITSNPGKEKPRSNL